MDKNSNDHKEKPSTTLPGVVQRVIPSPHPNLPEKAEIEVNGADDLYREIRVVNTLTDEDGNKVGLKKGAEVDVTIEADVKDTIKKEQIVRRKIERCLTPFDVVALLSSAAMMARRAETYPPDTHVIDLAELRQIIWEMQQESEKEAS